MMIILNLFNLLKEVRFGKLSSAFQASLKLFYCHPGTEKRSMASHLEACEELLRWPQLASTKWKARDLFLGMHGSFKKACFFVEKMMKNDEMKKNRNKIWMKMEVRQVPGYISCISWTWTFTKMMRGLTKDKFRIICSVKKTFQFLLCLCRPHNAEFTGIFLLGSKFSHSCAPNASWTFDAAGHLQYRAIRPIAPQEVLTFSYVGNGGFGEVELAFKEVEKRFEEIHSTCLMCFFGQFEVWIWSPALWFEDSA